jgi:hypothetical protein
MCLLENDPCNDSGSTTSEESEVEEAPMPPSTQDQWRRERGGDLSDDDITDSVSSAFMTVTVRTQ